ncbi:hypothetical protein A2160_03890 [Candidatus Beckwithbacteria bacterium RBG_13_42_9]|uniref:Uncharacterized protein n=1 Tax=Candidatus Beckwithbacteria bacterium RBG_13_42_9 TaxID=1797457 RepID=A0A1F5E4R9_9BACT|nr:MAG: hypothetical protein A2160_03890 [Candidatus Beckwithbacteria bacterium RBG_13_42_9]
MVAENLAEQLLANFRHDKGLLNGLATALNLNPTGPADWGKVTEAAGGGVGGALLVVKEIMPLYNLTVLVPGVRPSLELLTDFGYRGFLDSEVEGRYDLRGSSFRP